MATSAHVSMQLFCKKCNCIQLHRQSKGFTVCCECGDIYVGPLVIIMTKAKKKKSKDLYQRRSKGHKPKNLR